MSEFKDIVVKRLAKVSNDRYLFIAYQRHLGKVVFFFVNDRTGEETSIDTVKFKNCDRSQRLTAGTNDHPIGCGFSAASAVAMYEGELEKRKTAKRVLVADPFPSSLSLEQLKRDLGGNVNFVYATDMDCEDAEKALSKIISLAKDENCDAIVGNFPGCLAAEIVFWSYERNENWNSTRQFLCQNNHAPLEKRWQRIA
jgi:hypothetical protein